MQKITLPSEESKQLIDHTHPTDVYSIAHFPLGIAIRGTMPQEILSLLTLFYNNTYRYDVLDTAISEQLEADYVFTSTHKGQKWRKELGLSTQSII